MVNILTDQEIHPQLKAVFPVAESIGAMFGQNCEVVIHDLTRPQSSVIKVVNGGVTGRRVGQSFRDLVMSVLLSDQYSNDMLANYRSPSSDNGRIIKSSTALIRDENGEPIGALCINFDISDLLSAQHGVQGLTYLSDAKSTEVYKDQLPQDVIQVVEHIIKHSIHSIGKPVDALSKEERTKVVSFLDEKGVFLIKGGVDKVANELGVSRYTIYGDLDNIKQNQE